MTRGYIVEIPYEVEESALVDGCTRLEVLWRITLPLAAPGLAATAIFVFVWGWTEFLFAVILARTNAVTLPVTLAAVTEAAVTAAKCSSRKRCTSPAAEASSRRSGPAGPA